MGVGGYSGGRQTEKEIIFAVVTFNQSFIHSCKPLLDYGWNIRTFLKCSERSGYQATTVKTETWSGEEAGVVHWAWSKPRQGDGGANGKERRELISPKLLNAIETLRTEQLDEIKVGMMKARCCHSLSKHLLSHFMCRVTAARGRPHCPPEVPHFQETLSPQAEQMLYRWGWRSRGSRRGMQMEPGGNSSTQTPSRLGPSPGMEPCWLWDCGQVT